jgi:transposase-like protein
LENSNIFPIFKKNIMFLNFSSLHNFLKTFHNEDVWMQYLEEILCKNGVVSPFDATSKVYKLKTPHVYRCKNTGKNFTVRHGTIFHNTKIPLTKWFLAIWLSSSNKKGISSCQLSRDIEVIQKTAWIILNKLRANYKFENQHILNGEVELDETFVGGKNKNRHKDKKVKNSQGRSFKDKTPVFGMVERKGKIVGRVVKNTNAKELTPHILETVSKSAILYTDEWKGYNAAGKIYSRSYIDHGKGQYVKGRAHTNTIECAWSHLKRGIIGVYHYVSRKHLQGYVNEWALHYNTRKLSDKERFYLIFCNMGLPITSKKKRA